MTRDDDDDNIDFEMDEDAFDSETGAEDNSPLVLESESVRPDMLETLTDAHIQVPPELMDSGIDQADEVHSAQPRKEDDSDLDMFDTWTDAEIEIPPDLLEARDEELDVGSAAETDFLEELDRETGFGRADDDQEMAGGDPLELEDETTEYETPVEPESPMIDRPPTAVDETSEDETELLTEEEDLGLPSDVDLGPAMKIFDRLDEEAVSNRADSGEGFEASIEPEGPKTVAASDGKPDELDLPGLEFQAELEDDLDYEEDLSDTVEYEYEENVSDVPEVEDQSTPEELSESAEGFLAAAQPAGPFTEMEAREGAEQLMVDEIERDAPSPANGEAMEDGDETLEQLFDYERLETMIADAVRESVTKVVGRILPKSLKKWSAGS